MGTRSLTRVIEAHNENKRIVTMYRQYDGHLYSHGKDLATLLNKITLTNGKQGRGTANGIQCFAAQLIAHFKKGPGDIYLMPTDTDDAMQDYIYEISSPNGSGFYVEVFSNIKSFAFFSGDLSEFNKLISNETKSINFPLPF